MAKRIEERLTVTNALEGAGAAAIDEAAGVIRNVLICGFESANGRRYPRPVLERDCGRYEGAKVNFNHAAGGRLFEDGAGWLSGVKPGPDGRPRGDLNVYLSDPRAPKVFEAARRNPKGFGLSHVAMCETRYEGGTEVVEAINAVESVDIVSDPATVGGLFEDKHKGARAVKQTVKDYLNKLAPKCGVEQLLRVRTLLKEEDMGAAPMVGDAPPPDAAETAPDDGIDSAFISAATAEMQDCMDAKGDPARLKKCLSKLKKLLMAHAELSAEDMGEEAGEGDADADADAAAKESKSAGKKGKPAAAPAADDQGRRLLEAMDACDRAGFRPDRADLDLVAASPAEKRAGMVERLKKLAEGTRAETPTSATRTQAQAVESKAAGERAAADAPPAGGKDFATWVSD